MREPIRNVLSGAGPGVVVVGPGPGVVVVGGAVVVGVVDGQPAITITNAINNAVRIKTVFFKYSPPLIWDFSSHLVTLYQ
jgi:ammonia channel protein AmtB